MENFPSSALGAERQETSAAQAHTSTSETPGAAAGGRWALWLVGGLAVLLYGPTAAWLWDRWTLSIWHHGHGVLISPFVAYLVWRELRELRHLPARSSAWGFAILIPALALHVLDTGMHTQLLSAAAMFLTLPGLSLLFLGADRTKAILFPLLFLFLTLPIPLAATEPIHSLLRKVTTVGVAHVVPWLGIPLFVEGTTLQIPRGTLMIADACSGFSTLYAAVAVAFLTAYNCPDPRRRVVVLLAAAPAAVGANIVRAVLLVVLVSWRGTEILHTPWHTISGLLTFVLALPIILWLGRVPEKSERTT